MGGDNNGCGNIYSAVHSEWGEDKVKVHVEQGINECPNIWRFVRMVERSKGKSHTRMIK